MKQIQGAAAPHARSVPLVTFILAVFGYSVCACADSGPAGPGAPGRLPSKGTHQDWTSQTSGPTPGWGTMTGGQPQEAGTSVTGRSYAGRPSPPVAKDCNALFPPPPPAAPPSINHFNSNSAEDNGAVLNSIGNVLVVEFANKEMLKSEQAAIERLECEDRNIEMKLDYLIRILP
jgi:hypothetical protein